MLDVHGPNPSSARQKRSPGLGGLSLNAWVHQQIGMTHVQVKSRLRGNALHLLLEGNPCPKETIVQPLVQILSATALTELLPPGSSPVYKVFVYGRLPHQSRPGWAQSFAVDADDRASSDHAPLAQTPSHALAEAAGATLQECHIDPTLAAISAVKAARQGQPGAIARYLSDAFSKFGIAVRVRLESPKTPTPDSRLPTPDSLQRLVIVCESAYSPDPLLLAEPIAQRLRELELNGFRDAVVFGQVAGETKPEWVLRVDLTPPDDMLKAWAHWGDVQAMVRLLNRNLLPQGVQTSALLKDATLHLTCRSIQAEQVELDTQADTPDKLTTIATIVPLLEALSPQGIRAATIYGFADRKSHRATTQGSQADQLSATTTPAPRWVHWLDLATDPQPKSTLDLAQQGDLGAIAFLLTRMLNPSLDSTLATGGIQVQVRQKADLLHIMGEAPTCPPQNQMGAAIARFLKPLQIPTIAGVRIYGRRAGQKQPLWSYGVDFRVRDRLVPEATPEFAVSDAYVGDLLSPPGALVLHTEQAETDSRSFFSVLCDSAVQRVQRSLLWSQLFVPLDVAHLSPRLKQGRSLPTPEAQGSAKVATIWGAIGLLLVVQSDWLLSHWLQQAAPPSPAAMAPAPASTTPDPSFNTPFSDLALKKSRSSDKTAFNASGFTQPGTVISSTAPSESAPLGNASDAGVLPSPIALPASTLRPTADGMMQSVDAYPTFNSRQLDQKLALYQAYLKAYGTPDVLIIGSSRALRGVDPIALQKALTAQGYAEVKIFNFGINGATAQVVDLVVRQLLPQDKLPRLILWADGARAFNSGRVDVTFNGIVASDGYKALAAGKPPIPGTAVAQVPNLTGGTRSASDASLTQDPPTSLSGGYRTVNEVLNQHLGALSTLYAQRDHLKTLLRDGLISVLPKGDATLALGTAIAPSTLSEATSPAAAAANSPTSVLSERQSVIDVDGFLPLSNRFNPATYYQKYARVNGDYDSDYDSFSLEGNQVQALTNLAQFSQTHQIPLVFVNLPLTKDYLDPTRKRHEDDFQQHMLRLATQLGFAYRDLSQVLVNQPDYFSDPSHINRYGAYEVSRRLAVDVMIPWSQAHK